MADYLTKFYTYTYIKPEAIPWIKAKLGIAERWDNLPLQGSEGAWKFNVYDNHYRFDHDLYESLSLLALHSEGEGSPSAAARFLSRYLKKFNPNGMVLFQYANVCTQPAVGGFGGGAVRATAEGIEVVTTGAQLQKWDSQAQGKSIVSAE